VHQDFLDNHLMVDQTFYLHCIPQVAAPQYMLLVVAALDYGHQMAVL
jgi:hypothetical protein